MGYTPPLGKLPDGSPGHKIVLEYVVGYTYLTDALYQHLVEGEEEDRGKRFTRDEVLAIARQRIRAEGHADVTLEELEQRGHTSPDCFRRARAWVDVLFPELATVATAKRGNTRHDPPKHVTVPDDDYE